MVLSQFATAKLGRYAPERWGERGQQWLDALDGRVASLVADLALTDVRVHPNSNRSLVLQAKCAHGRVAVTFDPDPQASQSFAALDQWALFGSAPIPVCRPADDVDVRRWVAAPSAAEAIGAGVSPVEITKSVFAALSQPTDPVAGVVSQHSRIFAEAEQAITRLGAMDESVRRDVCAVVGASASPPWLHRQAALLESLVDGPALCHGDLTPHNVLWTGNQAVLIDAEPVAGSLVVDVARWAARTHVATAADLSSVLSPAVAATGVDEGAVMEAVRFGAVTYAVYLATFARPVDPRLGKLV